MPPIRGALPTFYSSSPVERLHPVSCLPGPAPHPIQSPLLSLLEIMMGWLSGARSEEPQGYAVLRRWSEIPAEARKGMLAVTRKGKRKLTGNFNGSATFITQWPHLRGH